MRKTVFISDIHLDENHPDIAKLFLRFLDHCKELSSQRIPANPSKSWDGVGSSHSIDAIYILGDLFEVWIGDDHENEFNDKIKKALAQVTQKNIPIYFLPGNRDYLIGTKFLRATGCQLLP